MFGRLWDKLRRVWTLAKSERASPIEIAWAVALGAFIGCTPLLGFHGWAAIAAATLFRKNRLFSWIGSRVSNFLIIPFITLAEIQLAHRVRTGEWVTVDRAHAVEQAGALLLDWCLGCVPVGAVIAAACGLLAWSVARRRDQRRAAIRTTDDELSQAQAD